MKYMSVLLIVEDVLKSRFLYETIFKLKVVADYGEDIAFEGFSIHQRSHFEKIIKRKINYESNSCELYFEEDKLEDTFQMVKNNNLEIVHEIIEQPWKQKALRFYDYDKNLIEVGESFEHMAYRLHKENYTKEEIQKYTFLNDEGYKKAITKYAESL
jgi:hypothetical protein